MLHLKTARLSRWQIVATCWSGGILWITGIGWLCLHYFLQRQGEFGPVVNPFEPWMLRAHGAAMMVALVAIGSLLVVHVVRGWGYKRQRFSGAALLTMVAVLTMTGYGLYYVGNEDIRSWIGVAHWAIGLMMLPIFLLHYLRVRR